MRKFPDLSRKKKVIFWFITLSLPVFLAEVIFQGYYYYSSGGGFLFSRLAESIYEPDPIRGYRVISNLSYRSVTNEFDAMIYTNSKGMRSSWRHEEYAYEKAPGTARILFLGPSFTFGWASNYEDIYATLLVSRLQDDGVRVEGINVGTPAQEILAQLKWSREEGYKYKPDLIVLTLYASLLAGGGIGAQHGVNVSEMLKTFESPYVMQDGYLIRKGTSWKDRSIALMKKSALVFYAFYLRSIFLTAVDKTDGQEKETESVKLLEDNSPAARAVAVSQFRNVESFLKEVFGKNTEVIFLFIPISYVVHPDYKSRWRHFGLGNSVADLQNSRVVLKEFNDAGLRMVDPTDVLMERGKTSRMYNYIDIHLTKEGNRVVYESLYRYIKKSGVISHLQP